MNNYAVLFSSPKGMLLLLAIFFFIPVIAKMRWVFSGKITYKEIFETKFEQVGSILGVITFITFLIV